MNAYLYSVVCMAAAGGLVCLLLPGDGGTKKHLRLLCALCLLAVMVAPMARVLQKLRTLCEDDQFLFQYPSEQKDLYHQYDAMYRKYMEGGYGDSVGMAVKAMLTERLSIPADECRVKVGFSDADAYGLQKPSHITVILCGRSRFKDPRQVEAFIGGVFDCTCVCAIE